MTDRRKTTDSYLLFVEDDHGAALPFVAVILVLLLGMAALATDLGWLYLNGSRVQRATDSAALAGVVHLPSDAAGVTANAVGGANLNGWNVGSVNGGPVAGGGTDVLTWRQLADNRLEVTLRANVRTFFMSLFGFEEFNISRTSTAEYVKPVPIGSPTNTFGDGSNNFWGSINGRWTAHIQGDPYQTVCDWSRSLSDAGCVDSSADNQAAFFPGATILPGDVDPDSDDLNPEFLGDGYHYGIEIEDNRSSFRVELFDPRFQRPDTGGCGTDLTEPTGDCDFLSFSPEPPTGADPIGPTTRYRLYQPDTTPLNPKDNSVLLCDDEFDPTSDPGAVGVHEWVDLCTLSNPDPGIYVLKVTTSDGSGSNQYGVRASTVGPGTNETNVYGIDVISIYTNQDSTTATLYLAEVDPIHADKTLELRFYDAGEDNAAASYTVRQPDGSTANCEWESDGGESGGPGACIIDTAQLGAARFNGQWLTAFVDIPQGYECDIDLPLDCWWSMEIVNNQPHDRTTWAVRVIGNPVHLVPNE